VAVVCLLLNLYVLILFAAIILSWFPLEPGGAMASVHGFLFRLTEPVLGPIRRTIPPLRIGGFGLDLSPFIVIVGIRILGAFICH
jgi:YggT family protein